LIAAETCNTGEVTVAETHHAGGIKYGPADHAGGTDLDASTLNAEHLAFDVGSNAYSGAVGLKTYLGGTCGCELMIF
jgi:hypothetical protein